MIKAVIFFVVFALVLGWIEFVHRVERWAETVFGDDDDGEQ